MTAALPGFIPSTLIPKTICERGVSLIWFRGSSEGSVERHKSNRPSKGAALLAAGNEMEKVGAALTKAEKTRTTGTIRKQFIREV